MGLENDRWPVEREAGLTRRNAAELLVPVVAMILLVDAYALWFVHTEQTLYHADQVAYWSYSRSLAQLMVDDPLASIGAVIHSVANNDVNLLPAVPISLLMVVFGGSRLVYVIGVITVYGLGSAVALVFALVRFGPGPRPWAAPLVFALAATVWQPVFIGYLGIGGVGLALVVIALAWSGPARPLSFRTLMLAGFLLGLLVLFRRWWGIWGLAFAIVVAADGLWCFLKSAERNFRGLWAPFRNGAILLLGAGATVVVLAAPILVSRLLTEYGDRFSAYSYGSPGERVASIVDRFGLLGLMVVLVCAAVLFSAPKTRRIAVLLSAHLACTFAVMVSIQDHSPQHWYLYSPQILLIIGLSIGQLTGGIRWWSKRVALPMLVGAAAVISAAVFAPTASAWWDRLAPVVPVDVIRPTIRHDLPEVKRLLAFLDHIREGREGWLYVLSSSDHLSDHVLGFSNLSLGTAFRTPATIIGGAHVDRRDGFPRGLLVADLVLVADPIQYHLRAEDQRVVGEPARSFLQGTDVAAAFQVLPQTFVLDGGVDVRVFRRFRPNSREEVEALSARLKAAYPDRPEIYSP